MADNGKMIPFGGIIKDVEIKGELMRNGECRYRMALKDLRAAGATVSFTSTLGDLVAGGWQNAHKHEASLQEHYFVLFGTVIMARQHGPDRHPEFKRYIAGDQFGEESSKPHNLYMFPNTAIITVKIGGANSEGKKDRTPAPELDEYLKAFTDPEELLKLCR